MVNEKQIYTIKGQIVTDEGVRLGYMQVNNGKISYLGDSQPKGKILDFKGSYIVPGFIDLHMHGIHSFLVDNGPDDLG